MTWAPCPHGVRTRGKKNLNAHTAFRVLKMLYLRKLSRLIGYLKGTLGQHTVLEMPEPGRGLV